jgi:hypothetical protein
MRVHDCPRSSELSRRRAEPGGELKAHMGSCAECREVWLVSSAMRSLAANAPSDAHPAASVTRILALAGEAACRREERNYRLLVAAFFAAVLVIWAGLVGLGTSYFPQAGFIRGIVPAAAALGTALWASGGSRWEAGEY